MGAEDVSRRTWERRRRKQADAGVVPLKLTNVGSLISTSASVSETDQAGFRDTTEGNEAKDGKEAVYKRVASAPSLTRWARVEKLEGGCEIYRLISLRS